MRRLLLVSFLAFDVRDAQRRGVSSTIEEEEVVLEGKRKRLESTFLREKELDKRKPPRNFYVQKISVLFNFVLQSSN